MNPSTPRAEEEWAVDFGPLLDPYETERPRRCVICNQYHSWEDEGNDCD